MSSIWRVAHALADAERRRVHAAAPHSSAQIAFSRASPRSLWPCQSMPTFAPMPVMIAWVNWMRLRTPSGVE